MLYQIVADHLETFLQEAADADEHGTGVPAFVERTFRRYLECGVLAHGFVRVHCDGCGTDRLVAFSCQGRGLCPSCQGRRMADTAARLVDEVLPVAPYRQWTLAVPRPVRARMLAEPAFLSRVLTLFVRAVFAYQRRRARAAGVRDGQLAAVTAIQRFGSALNLHPHFHTVIPDGVFARAPDGGLVFHALPPPTDADIETLATRIAGRVLATLAADTDTDTDALDPWTAGIGPALQPLLPRLSDAAAPPAPRPRTATVDGFSLHADTAVRASDRRGLERLLRYGLRPAFAHDRLELTVAGNVTYRLRRPWFNGQTHVTLAPTAFLRRLAWLIPPPHVNAIRFHGLCAARARDRAAFVALAPGALADDDGATAHAATPSLDAAAPLPPARRIPWAKLLARVFAIDVLECPDCRARMRVLAMVTEPDAVAAILAHLSLPTSPPPVAPARAPPTGELTDDFP